MEKIIEKKLHVYSKNHLKDFAEIFAGVLAETTQRNNIRISGGIPAGFPGCIPEKFSKSIPVVEISEKTLRDIFLWKIKKRFLERFLKQSF